MLQRPATRRRARLKTDCAGPAEAGHHNDRPDAVAPPRRADGAASEAGFAITLEFLLVMAVFVLPLLLGMFMLGGKLLTLALNNLGIIEQPFQRGVVWDSSTPARVIGPVVGSDKFEAPLVVFRDAANQAGVLLGVRRDRFTSYGEVFYTNPTCDPTLEGSSGYPKIRAWNTPVATGLSGGSFVGLPPVGYPPTGFDYQMLATGYAMGSGNILYKSAQLSASASPAPPREDLHWASNVLSWPGRFAAAALSLIERPLLAQTVTFFVVTGNTGAQTQIDVDHTSAFYVVVSSNTLSSGGGKFAMKRGSGTTADITLTLRVAGPSGTVVAQRTLGPSVFSTSSFDPVDFVFPPTALTSGTYFLSLTSNAPDVQSEAYFIKGLREAAVLDASGLPVSGATTTATPEIANITLSKTAAATVATSGAMTYAIGLGNDGGAISGTSATVREQLPAGVVATAVTPGTGVSSVSCGSLPSGAGALLTCTVALTAGIPSGSPTGTAAFTLNVTAPASAGTITNYASVDPTGGSSPATPGAGCTTTSCGSASTDVQGAGGAGGSLFVWKSQDMTPASAPTLNAPCFEVPAATTVERLVTAVPVIDFDGLVNDGSGPYRRPFRVAYPTAGAPLAQPCPNGECS